MGPTCGRPLDPGRLLSPSYINRFESSGGCDDDRSHLTAASCDGYGQFGHGAGCGFGTGIVHLSNGTAPRGGGVWVGETANTMNMTFIFSLTGGRGALISSVREVQPFRRGLHSQGSKVSANFEDQIEGYRTRASTNLREEVFCTPRTVFPTVKTGIGNA